MKYANDWEKSEERFKALWKGEIADRCCICVTAPKKSIQADRIEAGDRDELFRFWTDPELIYKRNIEAFENIYFAGEAFPQIMPPLGPCGHAALLGGSYVFKQDTIWFEPVMEELKPESVVFNPESFMYVNGKKIAWYLADKGQDAYFTAMPGYSSPVDALAHLRGPQDLLMDMLTEPDTVKEILKYITETQIKVNSEYYDITKECNRGAGIIGWLNIWAPDKLYPQQCDIAAMISPAMFEEFVLENLHTVANAAPYSFYHIDGEEQIKFLDMLLSVDNIGLFQWTNVAGRSPLAFMDVFKKIQRKNKCLLVTAAPKEVEQILRELSSRGLLIISAAEDENEANEIIRLAEKYSHE